MSKMHRKVAVSSSFNLLTVYLTFVFGILNTFVLARLLIPEEWALLILTLSFNSLVVFFCNLFPPNAQESIKYYIPFLKSKGEDMNGIKRRFLKHIYKIRLLSGSAILMIYIIITYFANFDPILFEIILIMSPMIIGKILIELNVSVLLGFQKFKYVFVIRIFNHITVTLSNFFIFFFFIENPLRYVSYAFLFGTIIACTISLVLVIISMPPKKIGDKLSNSEKQEFRKIHRTYGFYLIIADALGLLAGTIANLLFLNFEFIVFITYIMICQISVTSALLFSSSNPHSYISIFSEIDYKKNSQSYHKLFYKLNKFLMLFVCIIVGIMLFYIELYIVVIYSETYLVLLSAIQLFLFTTFAEMILNNLMILTRSTNNTKINAELACIKMVLTITITLIALIYFNFYILIIFYLITSYTITLIAIYLINRQTDFRLKLTLFFKPFIIFFISFLVVFPLNYIINYQEFDKAYLNFFVNGTVKFAAFVLVFYILFYYTKVITKEEFKDLVEIIPILRSKNIIIQKLIEKIEFFLPSNKNLK